MNYPNNNKEYFNPVKVIKTENWKTGLSNILKNNNITRPLIVTSKGNSKRLKIKNQFRAFLIIEDVPPNPTVQYCDKKINYINNSKIDSIIAIGGGSVMDAAKVFLAAANKKGKNTLELINYKDNLDRKITAIFIPTTHGTGSEVTMWGTIWDMENQIKYSISHKQLYPDYSILDHHLTLSMSEDLSIITSMDALSHSLESIWNKNRNKTSTNYAIEAISLIINCLGNQHPLTLETRKKLLYASTLAGLAFSNTKTAIAHSISYPLTMEYGIPHGIASSITLIPILQMSEHKIQKELKQVYNKTNINNLEEFIVTIKSLYCKKLKYRLRDWGVEKKKLPQLVKKCYTKSRIENYILKINEKDMLKILSQVY